jgi:23S rRNA pseudouridine1911/1915/1917 synthase
VRARVDGTPARESIQPDVMTDKGRKARPSPMDDTGTNQWNVPGTAAGISLLDHVAHELLMPPDQAADLIDFGSIQVNGRQECNPGRRLHPGDLVQVFWPRGGTKRFYELRPENILYRDREIFAYNKEASIPSQQTPSDAYNNLYAAVYRHLIAEGVSNPYVALHHRLDRETSGVMIFALDRSANRRLGAGFEQKKIKKEYLAWVDGRPPRDAWVSREDIGRSGGRYVACGRGRGKSAETAFQVIHATADRTLVLARPLTGRTHQIRLHLVAAGHPVVGDRLYGGPAAPRLYLHAHRLALSHPATGAPLTLTAPLPPDWLSPEVAPIPD